MGENSAIGWTDHTFNPWIGCQKVGPGCDRCYAETWDKRFGGERWGPDAVRTLTSDANWRKPIAWNRDAFATGKHRVFCASLADVFDNKAPKGARGRLWMLIRETPNLQWLVLTKRIGNAQEMLPPDWGKGYPNVVLMATMCNQEEIDRDMPKLIDIPAVLRGISNEPALGPADFSRWIAKPGVGASSATGEKVTFRNSVHWIITGGESGHGARPMHPDWPIGVRNQCNSAEVPFFFKQWGEYRPAIPFTEFMRGGFRKAPPRMAAGVQQIPYREGEKTAFIRRVGKKAAGDLLVDRQWREFPPLPWGIAA